jgi:hypothetical protein
MKTLFVTVAIMMCSAAFAQTEMMKEKLTEVKKKGCPVVNGKEDCTVKEVKEKVIEMKKKVSF